MSTTPKFLSLFASFDDGAGPRLLPPSFTIPPELVDSITITLFPPPPPPPPRAVPAIRAVYLVKADGAIIRDLVQGDMLDLGKLGAFSVHVDGNVEMKRVEFFYDGQLLRSEASAPYAIAGDASGKSEPWMPGPGTHSLMVKPYSAAGDAGEPRTLAFTVVSAPVPPPTPAGPVAIKRYSPGNGGHDKDYGIWRNGDKGDAIYENAEYRGFGSGMSVQNTPGTTYLRNIRMVDSYGDDKESRGQSFYAYNCGPIDIKNSLLAFAGRPRALLKTVIENIYRHNGYVNNKVGNVTGDTCIVVGAAACGIQSRSSASTNRWKNTLFIDNAQHVMNVMGLMDLDECMILGGHYKNSGTGWNGNVAISAYWPTTLRNVTIVGLKGQGDKPTKGDPKHKAYPSGCITTTDRWEHQGTPHVPWVDRPAGVPIIRASGVAIHGWPGETYSGDQKWDKSGVKVTAKTISYDWLPIINQVIDNKITVADAIVRIKADVFSLLG